MLGEPALVAGDRPRRSAGRSTSCRGGRCRRSRSRTTRSRGSRGSGRCTSSRRRTARGRPPRRGRAGRRPSGGSGTKSPSSPDRVEGRRAHAGHDPHVDDDVGRVGDLDAECGDRRAERAHRERDDVHGPAAHGAAEEVGQGRLHLVGVAPVVGRAGVVRVARADEGAVLDAGDVAGVGAGEEAVRALLGREAGEGARRSTICSQSAAYSSSEPSHQWTRSGVVRAAISSTQRVSAGTSSGRAIPGYGAAGPLVLVGSVAISSLPSSRRRARPLARAVPANLGRAGAR